MIQHYSDVYAFQPGPDRTGAQRSRRIQYCKINMLKQNFDYRDPTLELLDTIGLICLNPFLSRAGITQR